MGEILQALRTATEPANGKDLTFAEVSRTFPVLKSNLQAGVADISTFLRDDFRRDRQITIDRPVISLFWKLTQAQGLRPEVVAMAEVTNEARILSQDGTLSDDELQGLIRRAAERQILGADEVRWIAREEAPKPIELTPPPPPPPPKPAVTQPSVGERRGADELERGEEIVRRIRSLIEETNTLSKKLAKTGDTIRLAAVNDALIQLNGLANLADQALSQLHRGCKENDGVLISHEFARLTIIYQKATVLVQQAERATGGESLTILGPAPNPTAVSDYPYRVRKPDGSDYTIEEMAEEGVAWLDDFKELTDEASRLLEEAKTDRDIILLPLRTTALTEMRDDFYQMEKEWRQLIYAAITENGAEVAVRHLYMKILFERNKKRFETARDAAGEAVYFVGDPTNELGASLTLARVRRTGRYEELPAVIPQNLSLGAGLTSRGSAVAEIEADFLGPVASADRSGLPISHWIIDSTLGWDTGSRAYLILGASPAGLPRFALGPQLGYEAPTGFLGGGNLLLGLKATLPLTEHFSLALRGLAGSNLQGTSEWQAMGLLKYDLVAGKGWFSRKAKRRSGRELIEAERGRYNPTTVEVEIDPDIPEEDPSESLRLEREGR